MTTPDELDQDLRVWFHELGDATAPGHLLDAVARNTATRRPRPAWLNGVHRDTLGWPGSTSPGPARLVLVLATVLLLLAAIGGTLIVGAQRAQLLVVPVPSPIARPSIVPPATPARDGIFVADQFVEKRRDLSGMALPAPDIAPGLHPVTSAADAAKVALDGIADDELAFHQVLAPPRILSIRLLSSGSLDGMSFDTPTWVVKAEGTFLSCGRECDAFQSMTIFVGDSEGFESGSAGSSAAHVGHVPSAPFLDTIAAAGQVFMPALAPAGVIAERTVVPGLMGTVIDPTDVANAAGNARTQEGIYGPIYGVVRCLDASRGCGSLAARVPNRTLRSGGSDTRRAPVVSGSRWTHGPENKWRRAASTRPPVPTPR